MISDLQPELTPAELGVLEGMAECDVVPIKHYAEVEGALEPGDCTDSRGRFVDYYGLRSKGSSRTQYGRVYTTFSLTSTEFDPAIHLRTKGPFRDDLRANDDGGDGLNAFIRVPLHDDIFLIEVRRGASPGPEGGRYRLALSRVSPS